MRQLWIELVKFNIIHFRINERCKKDNTLYGSLGKDSRKLKTFCQLTVLSSRRYTNPNGSLGKDLRKLKTFCLSPICIQTNLLTFVWSFCIVDSSFIVVFDTISLLILLWIILTVLSWLRQQSQHVRYHTLWISHVAWLNWELSHGVRNTSPE